MEDIPHAAGVRAVFPRVHGDYKYKIGARDSVSKQCVTTQQWIVPNLLHPSKITFQSTKCMYTFLICCSCHSWLESDISDMLLSRHDQALQCNSALVLREAVRALGNLAANLEHGNSILKEGALNSFMALIRSDDHSVQRMAAMALCNLSSNVGNFYTTCDHRL